jgi:hypothetical protein
MQFNINTFVVIALCMSAPQYCHRATSEAGAAAAEAGERGKRLK